MTTRTTQQKQTLPPNFQSHILGFVGIGGVGLEAKWIRLGSIRLCSLSIPTWLLLVCKMEVEEDIKGNTQDPDLKQKKRVSRILERGLPVLHRPWVQP